MENNEETEFRLKELDVQRINLQPGDVLMVTLKHDDINQSSMEALRRQFKVVFPNNRTFIFGMGSDGDVKLAVVNEAPIVSYCNNCDCGKKELAEQAINENEKTE